MRADHLVGGHERHARLVDPGPGLDPGCHDDARGSADRGQGDGIEPSAARMGG